MADLPIEIIINILSRLPVNTLVRFKSVCKSWLTLINTPSFANLHLSFSLSSNSNCLLIVASRDSHLYSFDLDSPDSPAVKLPLPQIFDNGEVIIRCPLSMILDKRVIKFCGCCNGLLCLAKLNCAIVLLNPSTQFYKVIPGIGRYPLRIGLGFDFVSCDYKLVRVVNLNQIMVYSLKNDSWKSCSVVIDNHDRIFLEESGNGELIDTHLLHWIMYSRSDSVAPLISCFDVCTEKWSVVPLPKSEIENYSRNYYLLLSVLDGCLCMTVLTNRCNPEHGSYNVWVMKEYGVAESWVKLSGISDWVKNDEKYKWSLFNPPIAFCKERREILLNQPDPFSGTTKFYWFDPHEKTVRDAKMLGIPEYTGTIVCWRSVNSITGGVQIGKEKQDEQDRSCKKVYQFVEICGIIFISKALNLAIHNTF